MPIVQPLSAAKALTNLKPTDRSDGGFGATEDFHQWKFSFDIDGEWKHKLY